MYLEERIAKLEAAVEAITAQLATPSAPEGIPELPTKVEALTAPTAASLQDRCLVLVRKNPANKDEIKTALAGFHVKLLKDLNAEQLIEMAEVITYLESL